MLVDDDFFRLMAHNNSFENILGVKCEVVNNLHLLDKELTNNLKKTCCERLLKLIVVNMNCREFNPALAL